MLKPILFLLICLCSIQFSIGQVSKIIGSVTDSSERINLANSIVMLLRPTDSVMIKFTRTNKNGDFILKNISKGKFLLLITFPKYADYIDELEVSDSLPLNLPPISLLLKSKLLEEVVVKGYKGGIRVKGDTVEFKADSFYVPPGATVEDLLKKLPGMTVDKNGKITAQGETIQKVLVDGEEFFGDDPTLVTQNLKADMVDKVQLFDKKSDQATFTGIDDGQRTKTINLKLKDSKKNGYFGKLSAGEGTDGYDDYQAMINYFKKKQKLAAYGILSNTGKTGLNWQDRDNFGQSNAGNIDYDETSGNYVFNGNQNDLDTWDGRYDQQGQPTVQTGGIHYNNKWNDDRETINGNLKTMQLNVIGNSATNSQYILPDTFYYNNQTQVFNNKILRSSFDGSYEIKFDSTSSIKIMADGGNDHKTTNSVNYSEALASDSILVNQSNRTVSTTGDNNILNSNLLWRKRFHKKGRTLSVNLRENYSQGSSNGYLFSENKYYSAGSLIQDSIIDQYKNYHNESVLLNSKISYSEPLSNISFLVANYGVNFSKSNSDRNSFNRGGGGKYNELDSVFSNDYQFNTFTQNTGLAYRLAKKNLQFNAGCNVGFARYDQKDIHADTSTIRNFIDWNPQAYLNYTLASQARLNFSYYGYTKQPTIQQIQPIITNEDPLNVVVGNPGLKPQFQNNFSVRFNQFKILTETYIGFNLNYEITQNAISSNSTVDSTGKRTTQSINVNGDHSLNGYFNYSFKWKQTGIHFDISPNFNVNRNASEVDNIQNITNNNNYTLGLGLYKSKEKKFEFGIYSSATYTQSISSINAGVTTRYWTYDFKPNIDIFFPLKFQIHADLDYNIREKTPVFTSNNDVALLNAWVGKKFLKADALLLKLIGNDLLNENIGFQRTVNSNFISQNTYSSIKRYFMFSIVWNFNKAGTPAPNNN
jgi:signal peptidase I